MDIQNKKMFSVVIPLYNKREHIIRTIDSVLAQTVPDFEIVVVDDGSSDGGASLVAHRYGNRVNLIRQLNAGVACARNKGVKEASGEIIAFLDADDTWEPHFLAEITQLSKVFPEAGVFCTAYQLVLNGEYVDPKIRFRKRVRSSVILDDYFDIGARGDLPFMMSSFCIKRDVFYKVGPFPEKVVMGEDQDLFCRAALHTKIAYSPSILSFYHLDASNRACHQIVPTEECGFSKCVNGYAQKETNESKREMMISYSSAHLLHIASLNVRMERYDVAKKILSDERCKRQPLRYFRWLGLCWVGQLTTIYSATFRFTK